MSVFPADIEQQTEALLRLCRGRGIRIATAESCTGGLIIGALTEIAGSSDVVERGFVTYSNAAKESMLGIGADVLARFGAVSEETARAMAAGALANSGADLAVAVTGIAGPGGGTASKPVGLVHIAGAIKGTAAHRAFRFGDKDRSTIRLDTVRAALQMLSELADQSAT